MKKAGLAHVYHTKKRFQRVPVSALCVVGTASGPDIR